MAGNVQTVHLTTQVSSDNVHQIIQGNKTCSPNNTNEFQHSPSNYIDKFTE